MENVFGSCRLLLPPASCSWFRLEVETNAEPNLSRAQGARGDQKRIEERPALLRRRSGSKRVEVYEFAAEAVDSFVEHVVKLYYRTQPHVVAQAKLARNIQVEAKLTGTESIVARQVSSLAGCGQRKGIQDCRVERVARSTPMQLPGVALEDWPIVTDVIQVAVSATDRNVEWRSRGEPQNRLQAHVAEITRHIKRTEKNEAVPPIEQATRAFGEKVAGYQRVGSVHNAIVSQMRKYIGSTKGETEVLGSFEPLAKLERQAVVETIAG